MAEYAKRILRHYLGMAVEGLESDSYGEIDGAVDDIITTAVARAVERVVTGLGGKIDPRSDQDVVISALYRLIRARATLAGYDDWDAIVTDDARRTFLDLGPNHVALDLDLQTERRRYLEVSRDPDVASLADALNLVECGKRLTREENA